MKAVSQPHTHSMVNGENLSDWGTYFQLLVCQNLLNSADTVATVRELGFKMKHKKIKKSNQGHENVCNIYK